MQPGRSKDRGEQPLMLVNKSKAKQDPAIVCMFHAWTQDATTLLPHCSGETRPAALNYLAHHEPESGKMIVIHER